MKKFLLIFFITVSLFAQSNDVVTVVGDSLIGKRINGENIREVIGNVVITQEDVHITCNRALQYLSTNEIELIGNVVATQDTLIIKTERAYYYGNEKYALSDTNIFLSQPGFELKANRGKYYFEEKVAKFYGKVNLVDSSFSLNAEKLYYYKELDKMNAAESVQIFDTTSVIYTDSLEHFRENETSLAIGNIKVDNFENDVLIFGDTLRNDNKKQFSRVTGNPLLIQIDTTENGKLDTLFVKSEILESYNDSTKKFIAIDSVEIIRGEFASVNQKSIFYNEGKRIETFRSESEEERPILWFEESQLVGDSVYIYLAESRLEWINVLGSSIIISKNEDFDWRFDQISGEEIQMYFNDSTIARTEVYNNVLSIYYLFEEGKPSGLVKSSSQRAKVFFEDGQVVDVRLYVSPISEYHPENVIKGKEREFTLPLFRIFENRPSKNDLRKLIRE